MNEGPELFVECQSGGWIELQDKDGHPVASMIDGYLPLAHKMKAASKLYEACEAVMSMLGEDWPEYKVGEQVRSALADATIPELPPCEAF